MKHMQTKSHESARVKGIVFVCIACRCVLCCKRVSEDPLTRKWEMITEEPAENAMILQQAEGSQCVWKVGQDATTHRIIIQPTAHLAREGQEVRFQTDAGILVGTKKGEYGGSLSLTDAKGLPVKRLLAENVIQLLPVKSGVPVFTGLLHLSADKGSVWLYSKGSDRDWSIKKLFDLDGYPRAIYSGNWDI